MNRELKKYLPMTEFLSGTLGSTFETAVFDLTEPEMPALSAFNMPADHQDAVRELLREVLASRRARFRGMCLNRQVLAEFGNMLKVSVLLIPGEDGELVGALGLVTRCGVFLRMMPLAAEMLNFDTEDLEDEPGESPEASEGPAEAGEPTLEAIDRAVAELGIEPERASQEERLELICDLMDDGVFELKGAVARCAQLLSVSPQSIYRYITKIKRARG